MKKIAFLGLAAFAVTAACADFQGAMAPDELNLKSASPGTDVSVEFKVGTPGTPGVYRTTPRNSQGSCYANGGWINNGGNDQGINHQQCTDVQPVEGSEITFSFEGQANYVVAGRSGNINLNFSVCGYTENEETLEWEPVACEANTYIHYKRSSNWTEGSGTIIAQGGDTEYVIDLSRIGHEGNEGMIAKQIVFPIEYGDGPVSATLNWKD